MKTITMITESGTRKEKNEMKHLSEDYKTLIGDFLSYMLNLEYTDRILTELSRNLGVDKKSINRDTMNSKCFHLEELSETEVLLKLGDIVITEGDLWSYGILRSENRKAIIEILDSVISFMDLDSTESFEDSNAYNSFRSEVVGIIDYAYLNHANDSHLFSVAVGDSNRAIFRANSDFNDDEMKKVVMSAILDNIENSEN